MGLHKTVKPTYGYDHRSVFCVVYRVRKGSLVQRELSAKLTEGLTTPPPLRDTSPYTGEALVRCRIAPNALHRTVYRSALLYPFDILEFICRHLSILLCTANHPRPINSVVRHLINKHLPTPLINEFLQAR